MTREMLANELRQRQHDYGKVERHLIDTITDDEIIDAYNTCSGCGEKRVNERDLDGAIQIAKTSDQFIEICDGVHAHRQAGGFA